MISRFVWQVFAGVVVLFASLLSLRGQVTTASYYCIVTDNSGAVIPSRDRCYFCHAPQTHYTSRVAMDVGTATQYDTIKEFDIPQLEEVYMRPPFLHNGEALTLEEIFVAAGTLAKAGK